MKTVTPRRISCVALVGVLALGACYSPKLAEKRFTCTISDECPEGYACINRCCGGRCPACGDTLSGVGTADFAIGFRLQTTATVASALLFQRAACTSGDFWDVQLAPEGRLKIKIQDTSGALTNLTTSAFVNDGRRHEVTVQRTGLDLSAWVDGKESGSAPAPQKLGALPPLGVGTGDPCVGPLSGTVSDVCLTTFLTGDGVRPLAPSPEPREAYASACPPRRGEKPIKRELKRITGWPWPERET